MNSKLPKIVNLAAVRISLFVGMCSLAMGAAIGVVWSRSEVIPVVLVKPGIGGFEPVEGSSIGNTWSKSQVKAVLLVKPGIASFEPREGTSIGNSWQKEDVLPVMLVEPSAGSFIPLRAIADDHPSISPKERTKLHAGEQDDSTVLPSVIESQIGGDFEGWQGETIVKLTNGQIWQQIEYYYYYHYAFMPKIIIFKSAGGYKMKVDGVDRAIGITRLK